MMCDLNPCLNGGSCSDGIASVVCACADGYSGATCGTDIDECDPDPCLNGATCEDGINAFTCVCPSGLQGDTCDAPHCETGNPCLNSGVCVVAKSGESSCECTDGYTDTFCAEDVD